MKVLSDEQSSDRIISKGEYVWESRLSTASVIRFSWLYASNIKDTKGVGEFDMG